MFCIGFVFNLIFDDLWVGQPRLSSPAFVKNVFHIFFKRFYRDFLFFGGYDNRKIIAMATKKTTKYIKYLVPIKNELFLTKIVQKSRN